MGGDDRLLVLAGAAAGVAAALVLTLLLPSAYRADASIALTRQGQPPRNDPALARAAEAAAGLFQSRAVAESVVANLRLADSPKALLERVSVETEPRSSLVRVQVEAGTPEEARRTAQELIEVATVLFNDRFGPETVAQIWETPPAMAERVPRRAARNLAVGALAGALAGVGFVGLRGRRRQGRAGVSAEPAVAVGPPWTIAKLDRLLAGATAAPAAKRSEVRRVIVALQEFAGPDGEVPRSLDQLVESELGDLLAR